MLDARGRNGAARLVLRNEGLSPYRRPCVLRPGCIRTHGKAMQETDQTPFRACAGPGCREDFRPRKPWQKFHSSECRRRHWRARHRSSNPGSRLTCPACGSHLALALTPVHPS